MRTKIMNGARTLFREQGYSNVTMRAIGRKVGCSAAAIYRHFRNKREIMDALRHEGFDKMLVMLKAEMRSDDPRLRLIEFGRGYVRFAMSNPESFALMYNLAGQGPEEIFEGASEPTATFDYFKTVIAEYHDSGGVGDVPAETLLFSLWATFHGLSCLINSGRLKVVYGDVDPFGLLERALRYVVRLD
ncbi:MAG: TetR/AcrR family transcriptional regulator [Desulfovibrio sp.]